MRMKEFGQAVAENIAGTQEALTSKLLNVWICLLLLLLSLSSDKALSIWHEIMYFILMYYLKVPKVPNCFRKALTVMPQITTEMQNKRCLKLLLFFLERWRLEHFIYDNFHELNIVFYLIHVLCLSSK